MTMPMRPSSPRYPGWLILVGCVTALGPVSTDMYLPGFPAISAEFDVSRSLVQYTMTAFLAGLAIGQLLYGPLSDRIGRKLPLCAGMLLYTAASVGCLLVNDISTLIAWRFVQGAGACAGIVIGRAMVRDRYGPVGSARAFSLLLLIMAIGPMIAPLIGGWMVGFGWRKIFLVLASLGACLSAVVFCLTEETLPFERRTRRGTSTLTGQYRVLLTSTQLLSYAVVAGLMQSALYAYVVGAPFIVMEVYGIRPEYFGVVFFANTAGLIMASQINAVIVEKFGPDRILGIALLWPAVLSMALITSLILGFTSIHGLLIMLFGFLVGYGFISPNASALGLSQHAAQAGTASAVMGVIQNGLGIVTIFVMSLLNAKSALPLALVMGGCSCLAIACHRCVARRVPR